VIYANGGNNRIFAGAGDDIILTGVGNDLIYANGGNDRIDAGVGRDTVYAGVGKAIFVLNAGEDHINNYNYNYGSNDRFSLGAKLTGSDNLTIQVRGNNTLISNGSDFLTTLHGSRHPAISIV
jgi:Ca2+-binding RTX toxin-like protein